MWSFPSYLYNSFLCPWLSDWFGFAGVVVDVDVVIVVEGYFVPPDIAVVLLVGLGLGCGGGGGGDAGGGGLQINHIKICFRIVWCLLLKEALYIDFKKHSTIVNM